MYNFNNINKKYNNKETGREMWQRKKGKKTTRAHPG
jgi:hypothetical protein